MSHLRASDGPELPEIQGLRAIAALAVIAFHLSGLWLGWAGVWLFFPLSGFVITLSLRRHGGAGITGLLAFWRRRAARLLPLFLAVVGFGALVSLAAWGLTGRRPFELAQLPWLLSGTYNFYRISPDYQPTRLFGHLWSLAVEEQFYLLYPLAVFGLSRNALRRLLLLVVMTAPLIRLTVGVSARGAGWEGAAVGNAVYQFSPGHFDAFAIGCLLGLGHDTARSGAWRPWAMLAAAWAAVIVASSLAAPDVLSALTDAFRVNTQGVVNQVAVYGFLTAGSGALIAAAASRAPAWRWLGARPLVWVGGLSYGLYLLHLPLKMIVIHAPVPAWISVPIYLTVVVLAAWASRRWFERPAERWLLGRQSRAMTDIMRPKSGSPAR